MKKIIALVLTLVMVASLSVLCVSAAAEKIGDTDTTWEVSNGVLTIGGTGASPAFESQNDEVIGRPWESQIANITKVVVASGVTEIGARSFSKMTALKEIVFAASVKKIDSDAFSYCSALETVTFQGKVETIGQGIVFSSNAVKTVNLPAGWTKEAFKEVANKRAYNFKDNGNIPTGFDTATFVVAGVKPVEPAFGTELKLSPLYGQIENWNNGTFFILKVESTDNAKLFANLKDGTWKVDFVIKDETTKTAKIIKGYAFDTPSKEFYSDNSFLRVAVCEYGITPVIGHTYSVIMNVYQGRKCIASGTTEAGAFAKFNDAITADGPIIPETIPHTSDDCDYNTKPATPGAVAPTADASIYMVVVAAVAMLGMAVVVTKKVHA